MDSSTEWNQESTTDCLRRVLTEAVKAINLWDVHDFEGRRDRNLEKTILAHIDTQLGSMIQDPKNNLEGMLYAIRNKPESLLIYPVFRKVVAVGWVSVNDSSRYRDHLHRTIQGLQIQAAQIEFDRL